MQNKLANTGPKILAPTNNNISQVVSELAVGAPVAIPTETVYGLAADATNGEAVSWVYSLKDRPSFNPLITHVYDVDAAREFVEFNEMAQKLAEKFWPGPLTLVLPLKPNSKLSKLVSAGLSTAAVRVPAHPVMREVLRVSGLPLAAPSANPSGKLSATTAEQVAQGFAGKSLYVLDGGKSDVGVESTIVDLSGAEPKVLRYGGIAPEEIEAILGEVSVGVKGVVRAPGMMTAHYAPHTPVVMNVEQPEEGCAYLGFGPESPVGENTLNLSPTGNLVEAAANLFDYLFKLDKLGCKKICVAPIPNTGLGFAINDRLNRAVAAFRDC